ncbi:hypothetical protein V6Z11_D11G120500 [Gossypium hirsutum]
MYHSYLKETSIEVDLESGGTVNEDERTKGHGSSNLQTNRTFSRVSSDLLRFGSVGKGKYGVNSCSSSSRFGSVENENMEFWVDKSSEGEDNHDLMALLDAADQQLVREIAELSMIKRARIKRINAMKKMKAANAAPSSSSSLFAMVITVIFCLVILFQGICHRRGTTVMLQGSAAPAVGEGLISV